MDIYYDLSVEILEVTTLHDALSCFTKLENLKQLNQYHCKR
jgi:hypothetical protein